MATTSTSKASSVTKPSTEFTTKPLGNSDLHLTPIGFGAWAIGGGNWEFGWGPQDESESLAAIHRALDSGLNWIDTAAVYGLGHSEEVVGEGSEGGARPGRWCLRNARCDGTRIGRSTGAESDSLQEELEGSLRRLGVDDDRSLPDSLAES